MAEAFLVDAARTPVGRRGGGLAGAHPADLGAHVIRALLVRAGQQRPDDVPAQVGRVRAGQAAAPAADRRPDRVDQERLGHISSPRLHS